MAVAGAFKRVSQRAPGQHPGQVAFVVGAGMHVIAGRNLVPGSVRCCGSKGLGGRWLPDQHRGGVMRHSRCIAEVQEYDPGSGAGAASVHRKQHRHAGLGIVPVAPREFVEAEAGVRREGRQVDGGQHLIRFKRGGEQAGEELASAHRPCAARAAQVQRGVAGECNYWQFGGRVGVGQTATDRAPVANLRVGDEGHCRGQQRGVLRNEFAAFHGAVTSHRANAQRAIGQQFNAVQCSNPVEVNQHAGLGQPEVHHRDQALTTGQQLGVEAVFGQQLKCFIQRGRGVVRKRGRFHSANLLIIGGIPVGVSLDYGYSDTKRKPPDGMRWRSGEYVWRDEDSLAHMHELHNRVTLGTVRRRTHPTTAALSISPRARRWLSQPQPVRVLHVFPEVCNLVNRDGEVMSIATAAIGPGPFTITVAVPFWQPGRTPAVQLSPRGLIVDGQVLDTTAATTWQPVPNWPALRRRAIPESALDLPGALADALNLLISAISGNRRDDLAGAVLQLAGRGTGLTPTGDDLLTGVLFALRVWHPDTDLPGIIAALAAPRTTTLSAAFLRAAAAGEATWHWHALAAGEPNALDALLAVGHQSGWESWHGFSTASAHLRTLAGSTV